MNFKSIKELKYYLSLLTYLDMGSQGSCYLRKSDNTVLKIFHYFDEDDYDYDAGDNILKFSNIDNSTFIWPNALITIGKTVVGYTSPYIPSKNLYYTNPLGVNLDKFSSSLQRVREDIKTISKKGVRTYDVAYNIMYNKGFSVIDQDDYSFTDKDPVELEKENNNNFDYELYMFLVDSYFNDVVNDDALLRELYKSKKEDVLIFIRELRKRLSELSGHEISTLREAKEYRDKKRNGKYQRILK